MAYYGGGNNMPAGGGAFGGFAGGYNQAPTGMIPNANANFQGMGGGYPMGAHTQSVDPNNFPGTVHFGPSTTTIGSGSEFGYMDPNLGAGGANYMNSGF